MVHSRNGIFSYQQKYILDLVKETKILGYKPVNTPIEQNHKPREVLEYPIIHKNSQEEISIDLKI